MQTLKLRIMLVAGVLLVGAVMVAVAGGRPTSTAGDGGSFYASAGWTIQRTADLSVTIEVDDGASRDRADCAMKTIVGKTTWLSWRAMGSGGQLLAIRAAEAGC